MPLRKMKKGPRRARRDAVESAFLQNQLVKIRSRLYDIKYPELKARTFLPVDVSLGDGAEIVKYRQYDQVGSAKIIASYADDLPRADILGKDFFSPIRSLGDSYGYNVQEIRAARMAGVDLKQGKANAARRAIEQELDRIAKLGDASSGLLGLLNQPNALVYTVPAGVSTFTTWATKTGDEILNDLNGIADYVVTQTNNVEAPDSLILPIESFSLINRKRLGTGTDALTETVLSFFRRTSQYIRNIDQWSDLTTAGAGSTRRMVAYNRSADKLELVLPVDFEQFEEEKRNLEYVTDCHARTGGVVAYYPMSIVYGDGI